MYNLYLTLMRYTIYKWQWPKTEKYKKWSNLTKNTESYSSFKFSLFCQIISELPTYTTYKKSNYLCWVLSFVQILLQAIKTVGNTEYNIKKCPMCIAHLFQKCKNRSVLITIVFIMIYSIFQLWQESRWSRKTSQWMPHSWTIRNDCGAYTISII